MERPGSAAVPGRCGAQRGHDACSRGPARSKAHDARERVPPMRDVIRGHDFVPSGTPCPSATPCPRGHAPAHPIRSRNGRAQHFPNYTPCETRRRSDTVTACEHVHSVTSCPPNPNPCRESDHRLGVGEPRVLGLSTATLLAAEQQGRLAFIHAQSWACERLQFGMDSMRPRTP